MRYKVISEIVLEENIEAENLDEAKEKAIMQLNGERPHTRT